MLNDIVDAGDLNAVGVHWLATGAARARVPRAPLADRAVAVDISLTELAAEIHHEAKSVHAVEKNDEIANVDLQRTRGPRVIPRRNDLHSGLAPAPAFDRGTGEFELVDRCWREWRGSPRAELRIRL